jgi:hypothetical protein
MSTKYGSARPQTQNISRPSDSFLHDSSDRLVGETVAGEHDETATAGPVVH